MDSYLDSLAYPSMTFQLWMTVKMHNIAVKLVRYYVNHFVLTDIPVVHLDGSNNVNE